MARWSLVTLDLDGTLTRVHGWQFIAERLGRLDEYTRTMQRFRAGEIGEDGHLENLIAIARGVTVERIESILAETPRVEDISKTVGELKRRGARVALLTHNPPYVCEWYVRTFGLDGYAGSEVPWRSDRPLPLPGPIHADKPGGLSQLLSRWGVSARETVHVGDSGADARVFPLVAGGVAFNPDTEAVARAADVVLRATSLWELLPVLERLSPRGAGAAASSVL